MVAARHIVRTMTWTSFSIIDLIDMSGMPSDCINGILISLPGWVTVPRPPGAFQLQIFANNLPVGELLHGLPQIFFGLYVPPPVNAGHF